MKLLLIIVACLYLLSDRFHYIYRFPCVLMDIRPKLGGDYTIDDYKYNNYVDTFS